MERLNLYPEMNREIIKILRLSEDDPMLLYAAQLIEEQADKLAAYEDAEEQGRLVRLPIGLSDSRIDYIRQIITKQVEYAEAEAAVALLT